MPHLSRHRVYTKGDGMTLDDAIRHLDTVQAELTIYPEGCPEPWRAWMVEAHEAMCQVIDRYMAKEIGK